MGSGGSQKIFTTVKSFSQKGKLLSRADLQTLAESRDLDELVTRVKNTKYLDAVSSVTKPYTAEKLEVALRVHLANIQHSIVKSSGSAKVLDAYFQKFLISDLKLVLKGKALGKSQEEIESHINLHAEELAKQRDSIVKALVAKDLEEAVSNLGSTPYAGEITKAVTLYNDTKNIQVFDAYFDKILYENLSSGIRNSGDQDVSHIFGMEIDFYNVMSVIRGKFWGLDDQQIEDLLVTPSVSTPKHLLERMTAAESVNDALDELSSTRYKDLIPDEEDEVEAISKFEHSLEMEIYRSVNSSFSKMFSFATTVAISKLLAYEVRNIGAIAFAVEQNIPIETTMSKLIISQE
jgi:V/A-type H+/Na+-transporting ATPase subunit C